MAGRIVRTQWSKEPDEEPDYSDWKISLAIKKDCDDPNSTGRPLTLSSPSTPKTKKTPSLSLSSSSAVTFSVHRNILGPQSEYFNRIFKSNDSSGFSEARQQHSHIDLPSTISVKAFRLIVKAFEALLDYCYFENVDFQGISPVPLLYFCDYFQMKDDFESKVEDYSKTHFNEMRSKYKLNLLYEQIIEFRTTGLNVERAQAITAESCYNCHMYGILSEGGQMATIADLPLWLNVVSFIQERGYDTGPWKRPTKSQSVIWSRSIANFLENNDNSSAVDENSFQKLTNEKVLPYVDVDAALVLLQEEQQYVPSEVPISGDDKNDAKQKESSSLLTNLQNRCLESLVEAKLELRRNKELRDRAMKVMILLPRVVIGMYLNKTLHSYGEEKMMLEQQVQEKIDVTLIMEQHHALEKVYQAQEESRKRYGHDSKRRKLEQDNAVRLKNVEQELETEKEKCRLLLAERMNNRTTRTNHGLSSARRQRIEYQYQQQRPWKYNERTGRVQRNKP